MYDALAVANWQRAEGKGGRPTLYPRPGQRGAHTVGSDPIPIKDFQAWWEGAA